MCKWQSPTFLCRKEFMETKYRFLFFNFLFYVNCQPGREGTLGCLLHKSQKFQNNFFLFVDLTALGSGTFLNFDWLIQYVECPIYLKGLFRESPLCMYPNLSPLSYPFRSQIVGMGDGKEGLHRLTPSNIIEYQTFILGICSI